MRRLLTSRRLALAVLALLAAPVQTSPLGRAQRLSPHEIHEFDVDGCHFTINYGRPYMRGRVIWGGLVRWGRWWMPGADEATILTTSQPIAIEGLAVPAGQHTLYMLPEEGTSRLVVNNEVGQFHTVYHPNRDLGRVDLAMRKLDEPVEQMTFTIAAREGGGGVLRLVWADREYSAAFVVSK